MEEGASTCVLVHAAKLIRPGYVPRILAAWGMFTYLSMLLLAFADMLVPDLPEAIKMILYVPGGIFELVLGFWLLLKGVQFQAAGQE